MNDIYELKAQKYKLKYEKLLQELKGGALLRKDNKSYLNYKGGGLLEEIEKNKNVIWNNLLVIRQKLSDQDEKLKKTNEFLFKIDNVNRIYELFADINFELKQKLEEQKKQNLPVENKTLEDIKRKQILLLNQINYYL